MVGSTSKTKDEAQKPVKITASFPADPYKVSPENPGVLFVNGKQIDNAILVTFNGEGLIDEVAHAFFVVAIPSIDLFGSE